MRVQLIGGFALEVCVVDIPHDMDRCIWDIVQIKGFGVCAGGLNMLLVRVDTMTRHKQLQERWVFLNELDAYPRVWFAFCQQHGRVWKDANTQQKDTWWTDFKNKEGCQSVVLTPTHT